MQTPRERGPVAPARTYGLPPERLYRAWRIEDVAEFLGIGLTKARALMKQDGAPARLRTGSERCDRWNASEVLAWLHGETGTPAPAAADPADRRALPTQPTGIATAPARRDQAALTRPRQRRAA